MDQELRKIYALLLATYDVKNSTILQQIKTSLILNQEQTLRPDASLCLLTLYDNMIVTPYAQRLKSGQPIVSVDVGRTPLDQQNFEQRVMESFWLLIATIDKNKKDPVASSHDAIKAIDTAWGSLTFYFNWG